MLALLIEEVHHHRINGALICLLTQKPPKFPSCSSSHVYAVEVKFFKGVHVVSLKPT